MKVVVAALLVALATTTVTADVWQDAIRGGPEPSKELYEKHLREGDEHVLQADARNIAKSEIARQVNLAIQAYRAAAAARPSEGEPWFRIATTLNSFYLESCTDPRMWSPLRDCSKPDALNVPIARDTIAAWNEFEKRAPLDPRLGSIFGVSMYFERALLHTKLGTKADFQAAARDYETLLRRRDSTDDSETILGNLAETYMMLGRLDDAIAAYQSIDSHVDVSTMFGAAVALDRAGRGQKALQLIQGIGIDGYRQFQNKVQLGMTFFVPHGEVFYYYGLGDEAFGRYAEAIEHFQMYLRSGAHPQFHPRAKEHIEALSKKRPKTVIPPDLYRDFR